MTLEAATGTPCGVTSTRPRRPGDLTGSQRVTAGQSGSHGTGPAHSTGRHHDTRRKQLYRRQPITLNLTFARAWPPCSAVKRLRGRGGGALQSSSPPAAVTPPCADTPPPQVGPAPLPPETREESPRSVVGRLSWRASQGGLRSLSHIGTTPLVRMCTCCVLGTAQHRHSACVVF